MDRCALFVDASYALADGAMAVHGTRRRDSVSWDHAGLVKLMAGLARDRTGLPVLRCYWYETAEDRTAEHDALAEMPGLKLRLVGTRPGRRESIDSQLRRDIVTLAKSGAIADALIASADEHLAEIVAEVQDLGLRVVILHIASNGGWSVPQALRQECDDVAEISGVHLRPFVDLIRGAEPVTLHSAAGYGSGTDPVGNGSLRNENAQMGANSQNGAPVAALPASAAVYGPVVGSELGSARSGSSADHAEQASVPPYPDSGPAREVAGQASAAPRGGGGSTGGVPVGNARGGGQRTGTALGGVDRSAKPAGGIEQGGGTAQTGSAQAHPAQTGSAHATAAHVTAAHATTAHSAAAHSAAAMGGARSAALGHAGPPHATSDRAGTGQVAADSVGFDQHGHRTLGDGRRDPEQHGAGRADAMQHGAHAAPGQLGDDDDRAARQTEAPSRAASTARRGHEDSASPSLGRGTGQHPAQGAEQPIVAVQPAQPPQHATTSSASSYQGAHGLGGPRHKHGAGQEPRARESTGAAPGAEAPGGHQPEPDSSQNGQAITGPAASYWHGGPPAGNQVGAAGRPGAGHTDPGQAARSGTAGYRDEQGGGRHTSFEPYQAGGRLNGGAANGGPPGDGFIGGQIPRQQPVFKQDAPAQGSDQLGRNGKAATRPQDSSLYVWNNDVPALPAVRSAKPVAMSLPDAVKAAHSEGYLFGESVGRGAPGLWLEAVLARMPRMPSDLEARLLQGSSLPIDALLHDEVRHSMRRGFWDAMETVRR